MTLQYVLLWLAADPSSIGISDVLPWLASGSVTSVIAVVFLKLHQSALSAERRRADGWEKIAREREAQLMHILMAVKEGQERAPSP